MPKYTVNYFEFKWLAEPVRMILSYGDLDWEDRRFKREEWPSIKPSKCFAYQHNMSCHNHHWMPPLATPLGQAPFLQIEGGKCLAQSKAICRYLARETGIGRELVE
jgi:glutathione S-transferase